MSLVEENLDQAFDEVNDILEDHPSEIDVLAFKNNQLQKIINTLSHSNERLLLRIEELEDQLQEKQNTSQVSFNQEYSLMQLDFSDIEDMISTYKQELADYQQTVNTQTKQKNQIITQLTQEVDTFKRNHDKTNKKVKDLEI